MFTLHNMMLKLHEKSVLSSLSSYVVYFKSAEFLMKFLIIPMEQEWDTEWNVTL